MKKIKMRKSLLLLFIATLFMGVSCSRKVTRVSSDTQKDLSGRWNDTDSKEIAIAMSQDVLSRPWLSEFQEKNGKKPVVIIGHVANKTSEHIDPETFIKDLEREFVNSGKVRVVQDPRLREQLRQERSEQNEFSSEETAKKWGKEVGADYMLFGVMTSITDSYKKEKIVFYKVNLELADLETNEKVWIGDKEIKKYVRN